MYGADRALSREEVGAYLLPLLEDPKLLRARVIATFDAVQDIPVVDRERVSAIGFCFGGQCALELARSGTQVRSVVSLHGLLTTASPARRGMVTAKVLSITGRHDPYVPAADVEAFQREMDDAEVDWQTTVYSAGLHAFAMPNVAAHAVDGAAYDPLLDHLSWAQATTFLAASFFGEPAR
jgi:dienelactone hydrolase